MPENTEEKTLLQSLLDCFLSSKTMIKYVIEHESKGQKNYELALNNIVEWWKLLFSKSIVELSISPRSRNKQLSKDALGYIVRFIINDKNRSIVEKNLIPHFKGSHCHELIHEEVSHLEHTIDLGVRAAKSSWEDYSDTLPEKNLKKSADVQIYYEDAVRFLMQLFCGIPYEILLDKYSWFAECINTSIPAIEQYTTNQILSIFACALILCLNVTEVPEINSNIETYIKSVIYLPENDGDSEGEDTLQNSSDNTEFYYRKESPYAQEKLIIDRAAYKMLFYEIRHGRKPINDNARPIIKEIIDAILMNVYDDILGISREVWLQFDIERKAIAIIAAYDYELNTNLNMDHNKRI